MFEKVGHWNSTEGVDFLKVVDGGGVVERYWYSLMEKFGGLHLLADKGG